MFLVVADREQAAMHLGMQRLDPAVHHFGKAGQLGDVLDLQPGRRDRLRGAAGGDELDAMAGQRLGKFDQAGLVGNGQQSAGYAARMVGHRQVPRLVSQPGSTVLPVMKPARNPPNPRVEISWPAAGPTAAIPARAARCGGPSCRPPTSSSGQNSSGPRRRGGNPAGSRSGRCGGGRHCRPETRCPRGRPCRRAPRRSRRRGSAIPA